MIIPLTSSKGISRIFFGIANKILKLVPGLRYELQETDLDASAEEYTAAAILNSLLVLVMFFLLLFFLSYRIRGNTLHSSLILSSVLSFGFFILFLVILIQYPRITAGKKAEQVDKNLVFALKDLLLQISSGVSLYNALINISNGGYGEISYEFGKVAKEVNTGTPMTSALEKMAISTKSEYLKRTTWQLVNTLKAGASLSGALRAIIDDLVINQRGKIRDYAHELNLWSLIYMLFAVAIPTIGATMLVILSSFAGMGITSPMFILFLVVCFIVQIIIIGFVKTRRPLVIV